MNAQDYDVIRRQWWDSDLELFCRTTNAQRRLTNTQLHDERILLVDNVIPRMGGSTPPDWNPAETESLEVGEFLLPAEVEQEQLEEIINSLSPESDAVLSSLAAATEDVNDRIDPSIALDQADVSPEEYDAVIEEILNRLEEEGVDLGSGPGDKTNPSVLNPDEASQFLQLQGQLFLYANNQFGVMPGVDTYEEFQSAYIDDIRPLHERLYQEENAGEIIEDFLRENPADLSQPQLKQVESWKNYKKGQFFAVEHLEDGTVFLEPDEPRAYKVTGVYDDYADTLPEEALPVAMTSVVLLPYNGQIITDGLERADMLAGMAMGMITDDPETVYEEAKHKFGIAKTLPPEDEPKRSDTERLKFYTKNKENRQRFADEIEELKDKTDELARVYHQQLGKANARRLGREFRELGLEEAYVAIYNGQVVATAPTQDQLNEILSEIIPKEKINHPYVYHYNP